MNSYCVRYLCCLFNLVKQLHLTNLAGSHLEAIANKKIKMSTEHVLKVALAEYSYVSTDTDLLYTNKKNPYGKALTPNHHLKREILSGHY